MTWLICGCGFWIGDDGEVGLGSIDIWIFDKENVGPVYSRWLEFEVCIIPSKEKYLDKDIEITLVERIWKVNKTSNFLLWF